MAPTFSTLNPMLFSHAYYKANIPQDVFSSIMTYAGVVPLLRLASTSRCMWLMTNRELRVRQREILYPYFPEASVPDFLMLMREHDILITGGTALQFMDPCFVSNDLDLLLACPYLDVDHIKSFTDLISFIVPLGYTLTPAILDHVDDYQGENLVFTYLHEQTGKKIDVIISLETTSPACSIFKYHSSMVMNYITADGLYIAYPLLLEKRLFIINIEGSHQRPWTQKVQLVFDKYHDRGFQPIVSDTDLGNTFCQHSCGRSTSCPHTHRSCIDNRGCAHVFNAPFCSCIKRCIRSVGGRTPFWTVGGQCPFGDGEMSFRRIVSTELINEVVDSNCELFTTDAITVPCSPSN